MTKNDVAKIYPPIKKLIDEEMKKRLPDAKFTISSYPASGILIVKVNVKNFEVLVKHKKGKEWTTYDSYFDDVIDSSKFDKAQIRIEEMAETLFKKLTNNNPHGRVVVEFRNSTTDSDLWNLDDSAND